MKDIDFVTVVVPILNEEKNLRQCLDRLNRFPHVLVVDSGSTDESLKICNEFGVTIVDFYWNGKYPKKRNWVLDEGLVTTEWVLFLDADEYICPVFIEELINKLASSKCDGYWVQYENYFLSKRMRWGIQQRKLALFRTQFRFERVDPGPDDKMDMEVHEHPVGLGRIGKLSTRAEHRDYKGLLHFNRKHAEYAKWEAERFLNLSDSKSLTLRQKLKYRLIHLPVFPLLYFIVDYFIFLRVFDGKAGYSYSMHKLFYFQLVGDLIFSKGKKPRTYKDPIHR